MPKIKLVNLILDLFFPKKCLGCNKLDTYLCLNCISNIQQTDLVCPKCEYPAVGGATHPVCRRRGGLDGLWSLGIYQDPLKQVIKKLKYGRVTELSEVLSNLVIEYWAKYQPFLFDEIKKSRGRDWIVVPVPLFWYRENSRGFNQSGLFGKSFASKLALKYAEVLKRVRNTKSQVTLKGYDRSLNIRNAFAFDPKFSIKNLNIILIDDVWTTGSTLRECAYILKQNGAKCVWALTLAR